MFGYKYRKESGAIVIDGHHVASTTQCVHCGAHFQVIPGSGKKRGTCFNCNGVLCGRKKCFTCLPFEIQIEHQEAIQANNLRTLRSLESKYPDLKIL